MKIKISTPPSIRGTIFRAEYEDYFPALKPGENNIEIKVRESRDFVELIEIVRKDLIGYNEEINVELPNNLPPTYKGLTKIIVEQLNQLNENSSK